MTTLAIPPDRPFTMQGAGVTRAVLRRMEAAGQVRRLLRGVYVDATVPIDQTVREQAVALAIAEDSAPAGVTAAWMHGLVPVCEHVESRRGPWPDLLQTTVAFGALHGLEIYDAALRQGLSHLRLLAAVAPAERETVGLADRRARDAGESRVRSAWYDANLPTPYVGHAIRETGRSRRVALALPSRRFAVSTQAWSSDDLEWATSQGWRISQIDTTRITPDTRDLLAKHLRREFHRQLLAQVEAS